MFTRFLSSIAPIITAISTLAVDSVLPVKSACHPGACNWSHLTGDIARCNRPGNPLALASPGYPKPSPRNACFGRRRPHHSPTGCGRPTSFHARPHPHPSDGWLRELCVAPPPPCLKRRRRWAAPTTATVDTNDTQRSNRSPTRPLAGANQGQHPCLCGSQGSPWANDRWAGLHLDAGRNHRPPQNLVWPRYGGCSASAPALPALQDGNSKGKALWVPCSLSLASRAAHRRAAPALMSGASAMQAGSHSGNGLCWRCMQCRTSVSSNLRAGTPLPLYTYIAPVFRRPLYVCFPFLFVIILPISITSFFFLSSCSLSVVPPSKSFVSFDSIQLVYTLHRISFPVILSTVSLIEFFLLFKNITTNTSRTNRPTPST